MKLYERASEPFEKLSVLRASDGKGGSDASVSVLFTVSAAVVPRALKTLFVSGKPEAEEEYRIVFPRGTAAEEASYFRRISDGALFRILESPDGHISPAVSSLDMLVVRARRIPGGVFA